MVVKITMIRDVALELKEVAPPSKKAERMVKHIKKSYAKDGKLTDREKSIAYATAWKHHNKKNESEIHRELIGNAQRKHKEVKAKKYKDFMKNAADAKRTAKGIKAVRGGKWGYLKGGKFKPI